MTGDADAKPRLIVARMCDMMDKTQRQETIAMKYVCTVCGWVYDEEEQGTKWEDLPDDFTCELCGVGKEDFQPEE